jgi:hypothetical protein
MGESFQSGWTFATVLGLQGPLGRTINIRWQPKGDTALISDGPVERAKAPSPLRSAGAVQKPEKQKMSRGWSWCYKQATPLGFAEFHELVQGILERIHDAYVT